MGMTMRVSLPGYNALTDGTIDHYSVYADSDNLLIKEFTRGTLNVANGALGTITHNLAYIPFVKTYVKNGSQFGYITGGDANSAYPAEINIGTANIIVTNNFSGAGTKTFYYYIFYDQGTSLY
jgi:hypothetical protein